ncbi:RNA polymerase sigma factor [Aquimarina sp. M1]
MNSIKNQQIIDGIITGDRVILKSFYKKNLPVVKKLILQYRGTTEDVEDIFQEALVVLYHKLRSGSLEINSSIHNYFIEICKNKWRNQLRKQSRIYYDDLLIDQVQDYTGSIINALIQKDKEQLYHKHLSNLKDHHKNILQLFFEKKSMKEIANITGYTEGYARKKKFQVKEHLLRMMKNDLLYRELAMVG